jgi:hypothetical protein
MRVHLLYRLVHRLARGRGSGRVRRARAGLVLGMCLLGAIGCLEHRLTAAEVVRQTQASLDEMSACHSILDLDIDTDLLKDSISLEVWEQRPAALKVQVLSAVNPQLQGMAFTTDGQRSTSYSPHANQALIGPANRVKMPLVLERLLEVRIDWIRLADPEEAEIAAKKREGGLVMYEVRIPLSAAGYAQYAVDARQWWVRKITYEDEYLGKGQIDVRKVECFPELAATQFALDIPGGVPITEVSIEDSRPLTMEEAQMAVPFPLRTPLYLPEGTRFTVAYQLDKNVALVYAGERPFTLVQGPGIGQVPQEQATPVPLRGQQAMAISDAEREGWVLTWREDGLQFSIAGSLEQQEIIRIAESLDLAFKSTEESQDAGRVIEKGR